MKKTEIQERAEKQKALACELWKRGRLISEIMSILNTSESTAYRYVQGVEREYPEITEWNHVPPELRHEWDYWTRFIRRRCGW